MSTTTTILMQHDKHGDSPRKQIRLPAIAPKDDQSASASNRGGRTPGPAVPPRARLPPRSRTGCWTCRTRKVKCDEGRPLCGQCSRLGHTCDYSPRLSFRDDTTRVVERMEGVTVAGSSVWDPVASPAPSSAGSVIADDLPPFASLTTDEDRERKAEASSPGTYNVVVNPGSFQHLPEYSDGDEIKRERLSPLRRESIAASLASSLGRESFLEGIPVPGDPNTIVLPRFEDLSRNKSREVKSPILPIVPHPFIKQEDPEPAPRHTNEELRSLEHFRTVVWRHLVPTEGAAGPSVALLDRIAADFPPLLYAMMSVGSISLAQRDGGVSWNGLQHHELALSSLKLEKDAASDGIFLTHFLMLVHDIATADKEQSHVHLKLLLRIALSRRNTPFNENFLYIIWWICNIDLDTLFNGTGAGEFVTYMLDNECIPPPSYHLYPLGMDGLSMVYNEELDTLPTLLQLDYEVTICAVRLATLRREFGYDTTFQDLDLRQRETMVRIRQSRIYEYQEAIQALWVRPEVLNLGSGPFPPRSQMIWDHAFSLSRACLIYSHTSMWPAQRLDTHPDYNNEIEYYATDILALAQRVISSGHLECRFLIFPIFMAGFATTSGNQKVLARDLITIMEGESIGRNTSATRTALERIYEKQTEQFMSTGHSLNVDWMETMAEHNVVILNFGM